MIELTAAQVAAATGGRLHADPDVKVTGAVIIDSRLAGPGALFVALPGERVDGHEFAATAVRAGAALVLAARELEGLPVVVVDDPQVALGELARHVLAAVREGASAADGDAGRLEVVAVTGSVGKTTTKDLLGQLLGPEAGAGPGDSSIVVPTGSFNNEIGLPLTVLRVTTATRYLVLEMGADRIGNIAYLTRIAPPDVGVVLAVGVAHIGYFGSIEAIASTKAEMVSGVVEGGSVVLNADDLRVAAMASQAATTTTVQTFGTIPSARVRAEDIAVDPAGRASFTLRVAGGPAGDERADVALRLVGPHHVGNALAAAAVALRLGLSVTDVAKRLSGATALSPHRMAVTERPDGVTVIDDAYNANPDSMKAALRTLAVMSGRTRRSVAVLGAMLELGDGARAAHDEIGRLVVRLNIKQLVVVGDDAYHIHEGAMQEGSWGSESIFVPDLDAARAMLDESLEPGDVVLVKSSLGAGLAELGDHLSTALTAEDDNT